MCSDLILIYHKNVLQSYISDAFLSPSPCLIYTVLKANTTWGMRWMDGRTDDGFK